VKKLTRAKKIVVPHRRRRELKTDYRHRLRLLKSGLPRLVVRKSLNSLLCQLVEYQATGDRCMVASDTKDLKKFGWLANTGNIPAAYLAGLLCGILAKKKKINEAVLDIGLYRSTPGSRVYAALRGAVDAGLSVSHSDEILPSDDRTNGTHVASYAAWLKRENPPEYKSRFSSYLKSKITPESMPALFNEVKDKILKSG